MIDPCFVDTNLFVYARDSSEPHKQPQAQQWLAVLWAHRAGRTGIQVLNEYFVTVTRKLDPGLSGREAWDDVTDLLAWQPEPLTEAAMVKGYDLSQRFTLSWWDALVVAAAQTSGSRYLLTEDLQDRQQLDGVLVVDPFGTSPYDLLGVAQDPTDGDGSNDDPSGD